MKTLMIFSIVIIFFGPSILKGQESKVETKNSRTIRIDPNLPNGGAMSQVFSEINFIPLETTTESLFGDITQLEVTESNYIVFDRDTKSILIFDRQGKFKSKIKSTGLNAGGKSKDDKNGFYGFNLIKKSTGHIIQIDFKDKTYNYGIDGKLIDITKPEPDRLTYDKKHEFNDSIQVVSYFKEKASNEEPDYAYALLKNKQVTAKYFGIDAEKYKLRYFAVGGPSFIGTDNPRILHAVRFYDYNIYQITSSGISVAYTLVFPENNTIPADFTTNPVYAGKQMDYFFNNGSKLQKKLLVQSYKNVIHSFLDRFTILIIELP